MTAQELATGAHVVTAGGVVRVREIVADTPDVLVLVPRVELVAGYRKAGKRNTGRPRGDAVGGLPVVRPRRQVVVLEVEERVADLDLVQRVVVQHLRQLAEHLVVVFGGRVGRRGRRYVATPERLGEPARRHLPHQSSVGGELVVEANSANLLVVHSLEIDVEFRGRSVPDAG